MHADPGGPDKEQDETHYLKLEVASEKKLATQSL